MNRYKDIVTWSVEDDAERQYEKYALYILGSICMEASGSTGKDVIFSKYREKTDADTIKKLDWHDEIQTEEQQYIIEKFPCLATGKIKYIKFPAKSVVAYSIKMKEHDTHIEVFSILSNEHLVRTSIYQA